MLAFSPPQARKFRVLARPLSIFPLILLLFGTQNLGGYFWYPKSQRILFGTQILSGVFFSTQNLGGRPIWVPFSTHLGTKKNTAPPSNLRAKRDEFFWCIFAAKRRFFFLTQIENLKNNTASVIFITQMGKKSYPNRSAAEILGKKKYPAENLGTKKYPLRFGYQKYPPRFWVPKSNKTKGKIERGRAKTLNFRACGGLKANISLIHLSLNRREARRIFVVDGFGTKNLQVRHTLILLNKMIFYPETIEMQR